MLAAITNPTMTKAATPSQRSPRRFAGTPALNGNDESSRTGTYAIVSCGGVICGACACRAASLVFTAGLGTVGGAAITVSAGGAVNFRVGCSDSALAGGAGG